VSAGRPRKPGKPKGPAPARKRPRSGDRAAWLVVAFFVAFVAIAGRLVWLQVADASTLARKAEAQRTAELDIAARRGAIVDREGEPLAVSVDAKSVFAMPRSIEDTAAVAKKLAECLGGDEAYYLKKITKKTPWTYVERKVPLEKAQPLIDAKLKGIGFEDDSRRVYPSGELACQVLGFVGFDGKGLAGLEKQYDDVLGGQPGRLIAERDPFGNPIPGGVKTAQDPVDGKDIRITIDKDIQYEAQLQLAQAVSKYSAKGGSVVIMDPRNGEIYAMASVPTFNPNDYRHAQQRAIRNTPVTDNYEPGSTVKAMTAAAVIDRKLFTPSSSFHLPPTLRVGDRTIHESHDRGTVDWTLTQIVTNSSNVGAVKLGQALGPDLLSQYFQRFGLTEKTGVDFPGESKGWMPPVGQWSSSTIGNVPFGQGVSVNALMLARALGGIANRGTIVTPHFLRGVMQDAAYQVSWPKRSAISSVTAEEMVTVLADVVVDGTGKAAAVPGYSVAGKTGTAQVALPNGRGYAKGAYVASFAGFLPAEDPSVLIVVTIDQPRGAIYGGAVAAPVFSSLAKFTVGHLKIPPPAHGEEGSVATTTHPAAKALGATGNGTSSEDGAGDGQ
jgi:cell division protein FtsI/penicillin-binding protein 2